MPAQLVWLVTGCSSGFGEEFIKQILERGDKAIATARRLETIQKLADLGAATLQLDVTAPLGTLEENVQEAIQIYGKIDVLVANAGYVHYSPVEEADAETDLVKNMQTVTFGCTNMLRAIMPHWREQKSGFLLVNSSFTSWWTTLPGMGPYIAAKAALDRLITTFAAEVAPLGFIKTLIINAGHFRTDVINPVKFEFPTNSRHYQHLADYYTDTFPNQMYGKAPGDPKKGVKVCIDLVKGEGAVAGRELPPYLPLGTDAFEEVKAETEKCLKMLQDWEDVIRSTDVVPGSSVWGAVAN